MHELLQGLVAFHVADYRTAVSVLSGLASRFPTQPRVMHMLAVSHYALDDIDSALQAFQNGRLNDPLTLDDTTGLDLYAYLLKEKADQSALSAYAPSSLIAVLMG